MAIVYVHCSFTIPVEVPDDPEYDPVFDLEENHCPGTGRIGQALDKHIERCDAAGICWACNLGAENKIVKPSEKKR